MYRYQTRVYISNSIITRISPKLHAVESNACTLVLIPFNNTLNPFRSFSISTLSYISDGVNGGALRVLGSTLDTYLKQITMVIYDPVSFLAIMVRTSRDDWVFNHGPLSSATCVQASYCNLINCPVWVNI